MYPIRLGFDKALNRISSLNENGHHAEALVTSVFTFEKTLRRSLRFCGISRGFTSKQCDKLFNKMGFNQMREVWPCFERDHIGLPEFIGATWQHIPEAVTMRNKLAHGVRVYDLSMCQEYADHVIESVCEFRNKTIQEYRFDSWHQIPSRRIDALMWNPPTQKKSISNTLNKTDSG